MDDVKVYKDKAKVDMLYQQLKRADNWGTAKDVFYMRGIYGHCATKLDDFNDLSYHSHTIWLIQHKKFKYVSDLDLKEAYECMKLMHLKIPKSVKRKLRRMNRQ